MRCLDKQAAPAQACALPVWVTGPWLFSGPSECWGCSPLTVSKLNYTNWGVDMYLFSLGSESPKGAIGHIVPTEKTILAVEKNKVLLPPLWNRTFSWGFDDFSCCLGNYGSDKVGGLGHGDRHGMQGRQGTLASICWGRYSQEMGESKAGTAAHTPLPPCGCAPCLGGRGFVWLGLGPSWAKPPICSLRSRACRFPGHAVTSQQSLPLTGPSAA